jgi:glycosyltransferase involved in cell wall biosynthesis
MRASSANDRPKVSVILPTYNRAKFLPQAFASIKSQHCTDWELIVVDDGSTDATPELVEQFRADVAQPVRYIRQANGGPYAARNTGLDAARGEYVAFFDSDDVWLPHHLRDCAEALAAHPEVDWVYGACRIVELGTGRELAPHTFYSNGKPHTFLSLRRKQLGRLYLIEDPEAIRCQILVGLDCGLQSSVIRRRVFADYRFATVHRNEAEDQVSVIRALSVGYRFAYYENIHVDYHVHGENSSGSAQNAPVEKQLRMFRAIVQGFEDMQRQVALTARERRALACRMSRELFWHLGYALLWQNGRREEALALFRRGLRLWPYDWRYWKVYLGARLRTLAGSRRAPCES